MTYDLSWMSIEPYKPRNMLDRPTEPTPAETGEGFWGDDGFTFHDLLDIVNPLQHLPMVNMLYRELTGDTIAPGPRVLGGMMFGGMTGGLVAALDSGVEAETGKSMGGHILSAIAQPFVGSAETPASTAPQTPVPGAPGAAAVSAAAQSDAEFWAMRLPAGETPPGVVVGPVLTPPSSVSDIDFAQWDARSTAAPAESDVLDGYMRGGAAESGAVTPPAPRLSQPVGPIAAQEQADDVFATMMRNLDQYDSLHAADATREG